jgi:hypothetical protein
VQLSLDSIEAMIGAPLPPSARAHAAFWSNSVANVRSRAWRDAGFRVSLAGCWPGSVTFLRGDAHAVSRQPAHRESLAAPTPSRPQGQASSATAILIGCVSRKTARAATAKDLYTSELFRRRRAYAEATGKPWAILSAKHGLVDPDAVIEPYDATLKGMRPGGRLRWAARVAAQLAERFGRLEGRTFEIHAGSDYTEPLRTALGATGAVVVAPLAGLRIGEQLHWYASQRRA